MPWWGWLVIGLVGSLVTAFESRPRAFGVATTNFLRKKFGRFGGEIIEDKFIERPVKAFLDGLNYDNGGQDERREDDSGSRDPGAAAARGYAG